MRTGRALHQLCGLAFAGLLSTLPAQALPRYTGQLVIDGQGVGNQTSFQPVLVEHTRTVTLVDGTPLSEGEAIASAGPNGIRTLSRSSIYALGGHMGSSATASMLFDDLIISNLANPANLAPINVSFAFHLSGKLTLGDIGTPGVLENNSNVRLLVSFALGSSSSLGGSVGTICRRTDDSVPCFSTGVFGGQPEPEIINGSYQTPTRQVQVGVPQYLGLLLQVQSGAANLNITPQEAALDFMNTLDFVAGLPVFTLPAGYTANSASARIVNNIYLPVPEPAQHLLLLGGLALLGWHCPRVRR